MRKVLLTSFFFVAWLLIFGGMVWAEGEEAKKAEETPKFEYVGEAKCKVCHKDQHASWLETKHAKAYDVLSAEEKKKLLSAIADHLVSKGLAGDIAFDLVGEVYTLTHEEPWTPLRSAREFSVLLNATGRMDKAGLGVAICMGDRKKCLEEANAVIQEYRRTITKYLRWVTEKSGRLEQMENIYVVRGDGFIDEKVLSPVCTILSTTLTRLGKPIIAYATISGEAQVKVSSRGSESLIQKGLNLGEIMQLAAENFSGRGGGHDIAAGAQVPIKNVDSFIKLVNNLVKKQLAGEQIGG